MNLNNRTAGVLLHITCLPGPHGIGDFGPAAHHFVDWLQAAGQRIWQLLPMTPIGPGNSPYQSVSAFAGSPLMVALEPLVQLGWLRIDTPPAFDHHQVDFGSVVAWRMARLREAAEGFGKLASAAERSAFEAWCAAESSWLDDYSLFMALEAAHGQQPWWLWAKSLAERDAPALATARQTHAAEIYFWRFVQWCFETQWLALKAYANQRDVAIMGDLPIFIAHHSADCWARPDLYFLDADFQPTVVAGVPPDFFSETGQRWGNPLYRWDRMAVEGYAWWVARVKRAMVQADVFRIDHFRGFAAYWEVPASSPTAIEGRWTKGPGMAVFDAIENALGRLPIVAEDLGVITPDVEALRDGCGFPGMRVLQFAFGDDATHSFLPHNHAVNSVVYSGTHDNDTTRGWWHASDERTRAFASAYTGAQTHDVHLQMIRAACNSAARMAIFPLQDVLGLDGCHRMNRPGSMGPKNWSWRFVWDMVGADSGRMLGRLSAISGRAPMHLAGLPNAPASLKV